MEYQRASTSCGEILLLEIFGNELTIVNSARVSFGVTKKEMDERDAKLISYLVRHQHFSPFRHVFLRFRIKAPEFVMRQWYKHVVGAEWTSTHASQLHGWNEISGRYVVQDEIYHPLSWRRQSQDKKQGSDGELNPEEQMKCNNIYQHCIETIQNSYQELIKMGVAKEQARCLLPLTIYSEVVWTCSLQAILNFIELRKDEHAQKEIQEFAFVLDKWILEHFPHTHHAFLSLKKKC